MIHSRTTLLVLLALVLQAKTAHSQTLYGNAVGQLITIDTTTGAGTWVAPTVSSWAMAFRGNQLYTWSPGANRLIEIDRATGATINTIDIGLSAPFGGDVALRADGVGFIAQYSPSQLVQFDVAPPSSSLIGPLSVSMFGLAFSPSGILYGLATGGDTLNTIDPTTGAVTLIGNTGLTGIPNGAMACDASGNLFATLTTPGVGTSIYRLDPSTGLATVIGNVGFSPIGAISFTPPPPPPPPKPAPPPPPPNGDEGTYRRCTGPRGPEGTFGFGGGIALARRPLLAGPFRSGSDVTVVNPARPLADTLPDSQSEVTGWTILAALIGLFAAALLMKSRC